MSRVAEQSKQDWLPISLYYSFKTMPFIVGGISIYLGYRLFISGVTGQASLSINTKTVSGQLLNAAPGLFFAVGGIITVIIASVKGMRMIFQSDNSGSKFCLPDETMREDRSSSRARRPKMPQISSTFSAFNPPEGLRRQQRDSRRGDLNNFEGENVDN